MVKKILRSKAILLATTSLIFANASMAQSDMNDADYREVYVGADFGLSEPVIKKFSYKDEKGFKTDLRLDNSPMYGGRIGYVFYPSMKIELSASHRPKYRIGYTLPAARVSPDSDGSGKTTADAKIFNLRLIYSMSEQFAGVKPYAMFGVGVANMSIKYTESTMNTYAYGAAATPNVPFFRVNKNNINCFSWQVGAGFTKDITDDLSLDFGAKLYVVNDIKIKYDILDVDGTNATIPTGFTPKYDSQKPIKKTIGVGEFTIGLAYKFPV